MGILPSPPDWRKDPQTIALLTCLWRGGWGHLWRRPGASYWIDPQELGHALSRLGDQWATDTYFGVHPAASAKSAYERARAEDIVAASALFADFDADDEDPQALLARIEALRPAPSVIVASGGGYHAYWLLAEPVILGDDEMRRDWAALQRWWVKHVGADQAACDLARLLRVPGTTNAKYDPPRPVRFVRCDLDALHDNAALMRYILDARTAELLRQEQPQAQGERRERPAGRGGAIGGVIRWLATQRPGNRNCATFWAAHRLREAGVTHEHAQALLAPIATSLGLPEREAARTITSAYTGGA